MTQNTQQTQPMSPVYGPVYSWRFGNSLGIDLLLQTSICSFDCVYCQLGAIEEITLKQDVYVPTQHVIDALKEVDWSTIDVVTFSGSGEPTLALNLHEVIDHIKNTYKKPVTVLTNSTWLHDAATRERLMNAETVACKLDAVDDRTLNLINRPVEGVTIDTIVNGIKMLRVDGYQGKLALQCMFLALNKHIGPALAEVVADIQPDEVELNTPTRPVPRIYYAPCRGNHGGEIPVGSTMLKQLSKEEIDTIANTIRDQNPGLFVRTVYDKPTST